MPAKTLIPNIIGMDIYVDADNDLQRVSLANVTNDLGPEYFVS